MEIQNAITTPSKSNQLRNVNSVQCESRNMTTQPRELHDRKSEVIAFVINAGMNITANNFVFKLRNDVSSSSSELFALFNWRFVGYHIRNLFLKFRVINGEYIVKISRVIVKLVFKDLLFRFVKVRHKIPLITKCKQIYFEWSTVCAHRNIHYLLIYHAFKLHIYVPCGNLKLHIAELKSNVYNIYIYIYNG